jgi:hypothetical protein
MVEFFARDYPKAGQLYEELYKDDPLGGGRGGFYGAIDYRSAIARIGIESGDAGGTALIAKCRQDCKMRLIEAPSDAETLYRLSAIESMAGNKAESLRFLRMAIRAGWIDHRSPRLDPRFDAISPAPEFQAILSELADNTAQHGRHSPTASAR